MSVQGINDLTKDASAVRDYVRTILAQNAFSSESPLNTSLAAGLPSPLDYINYFKLISERLNTTDGALFLAKQGMLKLMNPVLGMGKLYNPASALTPLPFAAGEVTDFLEAPVASANRTETIILNEDRLKKLTEGVYTDSTRVGTFQSNVQINEFRYPDGMTVLQKNIDNNMFDADNQATNNEYFDNSSWQDGGRDGRQSVTKNGVTYDVPDLTKMFDHKKRGPAFSDGHEKGVDFFKPKKGIRQKIVYDLDSVDWVNDQDTFLSQDDFLNGYTEEEFEDGALYIPFSFEDLRKTGRKIFFRAFLDTFSESLTPKWQQEEYFGRVDPVVSYKSTGRTFNVTFKIMPLTPAGFTAMWRKVNNLHKMCYPTMRNGALVRSPVIRLRIGDVMADTSGNGLPGYLDKLEMNYSHSIWETTSYNGPVAGIELGKAPMKIEISLTFVVIHEINPVLDDNYRMNFSSYRRIGTSQEDLSQMSAEDQQSVDFTLSETEPADTTSPPPESI